MTNYEELEKAIETMGKLDEAPWEMQQTIYLGAIAQFLAKIADVLEQKEKNKELEVEPQESEDKECRL